MFSYLPLDKIKKRYGALGQVIACSIDRGTNSNLGISLAGHRDRTKMACFVAGINPRGAAKQTELEVGDEILEVIGLIEFSFNFLTNFFLYLTRLTVLCFMVDVI